MTVSSYLLQFSLYLIQFFLSFFSSFSMSFPVLKPLVLVLTPLPSIFCPSNFLKGQQKQPAGTTFLFYHNLHRKQSQYNSLLLNLSSNVERRCQKWKTKSVSKKEQHTAYIEQWWWGRISNGINLVNKKIMLIYNRENKGRIESVPLLRVSRYTRFKLGIDLRNYTSIEFHFMTLKKPRTIFLF